MKKYLRFLPLALFGLILSVIPTDATDLAHQNVAIVDGGAVVSASNPLHITGAIGPTDANTVFELTKDVVSSSVVAADTTLWTASGTLTILKIIAQTDGTGLATCVNYVLDTNDTFGKATIASQAITGLGANVTLDLLNAATTAFVPFTITNGKHIRDKSSTATACDGAGVIRLTIIAKRLTANATLN